FRYDTGSRSFPLSSSDSHTLVLSQNSEPVRNPCFESISPALRAHFSPHFQPVPALRQRSIGTTRGPSSKRRLQLRRRCGRSTQVSPPLGRANEERARRPIRC